MVVRVATFAQFNPVTVGGDVKGDEIYRCPACGSGRIAAEIVRAPKGATTWTHALNQAVGEHDICTDCGERWVRLSLDDLPSHDLQQPKR